MDCRIRLFREDDADALSALALRAVRVIGARASANAQIDAWAAGFGHRVPFAHRVRAGQILLVAADADDAACAVVLRERDGHLDHLYGDPDYTQRGIADQLLAEAEVRARAAGATRLYTEASELARRTFERAGYRVTDRREFRIEHAGKRVPIHNYAMEKPLA